MTPAAHPLPGDRFGRLTVVGDGQPPAGVQANSHRYLECRCRCGNLTTTTSTALRSGRTRSCGCLHRDLRRLEQAQRLGLELQGVIEKLADWRYKEAALASLRQVRADVRGLADIIEGEKEAA